MTFRKGLTLVIFLAAAGFLGGCGDDGAEGGGKCVDLRWDLAKAQLACWADSSAACDDDVDAFEDACDCAKDGQFWYMVQDDGGDVDTNCLGDPSSDYEWCFWAAVAGNTLTEDNVDAVDEMCQCRTKDKGYYGVPVDDDEAECYDDKETFCFETSADNNAYAQCMCEAEEWSKEGIWEGKVVDADTGECVSQHACGVEKVGLEKLLNDGVCDDGALLLHEVDD